MMHELWCVSSNTMTNITPLVGSITWRSNTNELGEQVDFDIAFNDNRYFPKNPVDLGKIIVLKNENKEINRTIVVKETRNGRGAISYTCFDFAFYLNKSKEIYQFNKMPASQAIKKICQKVGVTVGNINLPNVLIVKTYNEKTHSDVIKDIIDTTEKQTGSKYRMEMQNGKLYIDKQDNLVIKPTFKLSSNIALELCVNAISGPTRSRGIEEMRNSIKVILQDDKKIKVVSEVKNDSLIKQYGLLQEISTVSKEDLAQAKIIAKNTLKELGKVFEENSITVPGNDEIRAGRLIEISEPITGMKGKYLIQSAQHSIKNGIHACNIGLEVI